MSEVIAVIPARGGSKGIPRKNLKDLGGKPLITHQIENALNASLVDRTIVSSDDKEILEVAEEYGADTPFVRPDDLSTDDVPVIAVYKHAMEWFDEHKDSPEYIVGLQPTCPFTRPEEIDTAIQKIGENRCDTVVSVAKVTDTHPYRTYTLNGDRLEPFEGMTVEEPLQRQDRPDVYGLTGSIFVRARHVLEAWDYDDFALGRETRTIVQTEEQTFDIDTPFELRMARALHAFEDNE